MKHPYQHLATVLGALAALAALPSAQAVPLPYRSGLQDAECLTAVRDGAIHVGYDLATRRVVPLAEVPGLAAAPATSGVDARLAPGTQSALALVGTPCFVNGDQNFLSLIFSVTSVGQELVDWGVKDCDLSGVVSSFTIGYRTTAIDTTQGGPGAAFEFAIYDGTIGFGNLGSQVRREALGGLPARGYPAGDPTSYQVGDTQVVFLTVFSTAAPLLVPDGAVGWGFTQVDGATGPLLVFGSTAEEGVVSLLDTYAPAPASPASYQFTGNFGFAGPFASMYVVLNEVDPGVWPASAVPTSGGGTNPMLYQPANTPIMGRFWFGQTVPTVDSTSFAAFSAFQIAPTPFGAAGDLLVDLTQLTDAIQASSSGHAYYVPLDLTFVGQTFYTQAARYTPTNGIELLNRIDLTLGL